MCRTGRGTRCKRGARVSLSMPRLCPTRAVFAILYGYGAGMSMDRHGANHGNTFHTIEEDPQKIIASFSHGERRQVQLLREPHSCVPAALRRRHVQLLRPMAMH